MSWLSEILVRPTAASRRQCRDSVPAGSGAFSRRRGRKAHV